MGRFGREEKDPLGKLGGCCKDKKHRGLGLRCLEALNRALLGKWLWRFSLEGESLWRKIILGIFWEVEGGWITRGVRESYAISLWKDIRKGWEEFSLRTNIRIGNGRRTRFWWDNWNGESKLKDVYPTLFRITSHKNAIVVNLWEREGGRGGHWEIQVRRLFQDWELEEVTHFLEHIFPLKVEGENLVSSHFIIL